MLSVERVKKLINDPKMSDEEVEKVRDELYLLAEVIFEQWMTEQNRAKNNAKKENPKI